MEMIEITDTRGAIVAALWLERAEAVHRELRTTLPAEYRAKMQRVFAGGGRMVVAAERDAVCGLAVWRVHENTAIGVHLYVDDLVTAGAQRSIGWDMRSCSGSSSAPGSSRAWLWSSTRARSAPAPIASISAKAWRWSASTSARTSRRKPDTGGTTSAKARTPRARLCAAGRGAGVPGSG